MISMNGTISNTSAFNWLKDSGFRYGYGCFETMRFSKNTIRHLDLHAHRLTHGLKTLGIDYDPAALQDRIHSLATHLQISTPQTCHVFVTGGPVLPTPKHLPLATEIISFSSMPASNFSNTCELLSIQPSEYFQLKSLSYMHHIQALRASNHWPIYVDSNGIIIDSSIFSVGIIDHDRIIFAMHPHQLPSVSKQAIMRDFDCDHRPIQKNELMQAPAMFGCNALRGAFPIRLSSHTQMTRDCFKTPRSRHSSQHYRSLLSVSEDNVGETKRRNRYFATVPTHPMIDTMNNVLGFDDCDFC